MEKYSMQTLAPGMRATVKTVKTGELLERRLLDMGMAPGAAVECLFAAPGGDPKAYLVMGTVVAIRCEDAAMIVMEDGPGPKGM